MKNNQLLGANKFSAKVLLTSIILLVLFSINYLNAQVSFTQTADADFNKGVLNNVAVGSNNVYLQFAATSINAWTNTFALPQALSGHKATTNNNKYIYVVGGYNGSAYSSGVYYATITTGGVTAWIATTSLPVGLKDAAVVVGANAIYVMGGRNSTQVFNTIYYATINTDGSLGTWQTSAVTLPSPLWGHTAVFLNGYIYVAGGSDLLAETSAINTVYYAQVKADNSLSAFSTGTGLPDECNKHTMVTYNSNIYILGGYDSLGTKKNTVYYVTPGENGPIGAWSEATPLPVSLSNHATVISNGLIIVMGGATSSTLSNTVYYANIDQALPWTWVTSPNLMPDNTKDGSVAQGNGQVVYIGGTNLSGVPLSYCRNANLTLTANYVNHGVFISYPFYELGAERLIISLTFSSSFVPAYANCQISYRTAGSDEIWSDWSALNTTSPISVNLFKQYLQYKIIFSGQLTYNSTMSDMVMKTIGTQLTGNLNATDTFRLSASPFWVIGNIDFSAGQHVFQAGTEVLFYPGTGLIVSGASVKCLGNATDSVRFQNIGVETGKWNGIYFDPNSDNTGFSSQFYYTIVANAGYGTNNANIYCNTTTEPTLHNCSVRYADGHGIRLALANISVNNSVIKGNTENGVNVESNSNPSINNSYISYNGGAGIYLNAPSSVPYLYGTTIDHNLYGLRFGSPDGNFSQPAGMPSITANTYNGIALNGGDITTTDKTWNSLPYDYFLLGSIRIMQSASKVRLTIKPGNTIRVISGANIQVGNITTHGGELYAVGKTDSLITFTPINGLSGGWNGIYFTDYSDYWLSAKSKLEYCIIEKGNSYNYYSENTKQPDTVNYCTIRNAVQDGAQYSSAVNGIITNSKFLNNGRYPLYFITVDTDPYHTNNTITGNGINKIVIYGGSYTTTNRILVNEGAPYYVLNDINIANRKRLTVNPGVVVEFAAGKRLTVGASSQGASLYARGTAGQPIV